MYLPYTIYCLLDQMKHTLKGIEIDSLFAKVLLPIFQLWVLPSLLAPSLKFCYNAPNSKGFLCGRKQKGFRHVNFWTNKCNH